MADISKFFDKGYEQVPFDELADAPLEAIQGLSENDAKALKDALGIETVRELAEHKFVRIAQAVMALSTVPVGSGAQLAESEQREQGRAHWHPYTSNVRVKDIAKDFKDFLLDAPDLERLEIHRSKDPEPPVEFR
jgi:hypothetical protein